MTKVHVPVSQVWHFFRLNSSRLAGEMVLLAESTDDKAEVYLTSEHDMPLFKVYLDDEFDYDEFAVDDEDCQDVAWKLYRNYIYGIGTLDDDEGSPYEVVDNDDGLDDPVDDETLRDETILRDTELYDAMYDFLVVAVSDEEVVMLDDPKSTLVTEALEEFLPILASKFSISVRHPMYDTDEEGNEVYIEYPYDDYLGEDGEEPEENK